MIVGMTPMAIGGPVRNRMRRWRPIAGGLLFATLTTLLIVPYLFALLRKGSPPRPSLLTPDCDSTPPPDGTNGRGSARLDRFDQQAYLHPCQR